MQTSTITTKSFSIIIFQRNNWKSRHLLLIWGRMRVAMVSRSRKATSTTCRRATTPVRNTTTNSTLPSAWSFQERVNSTLTTKAPTCRKSLNRIRGRKTSPNRGSTTSRIPCAPCTSSKMLFTQNGQLWTNPSLTSSSIEAKGLWLNSSNTIWRT